VSEDKDHLRLFAQVYLSTTRSERETSEQIRQEIYDGSPHITMPIVEPYPYLRIAANAKPKLFDRLRLLLRRAWLRIA